METNNKKYPKTKSNLQCIGPCYQPDTVITHPITLKYITDKSLPFCPVYAEDIDKQGNKKIIQVAECNVPTEKNDISNYDIEYNLLIPHIDLTAEYFLKKYYDIISFEKILDWLNNKKYVPIKTKMRVVECGWNAFGNSLDILDQRIVDFYLELIKKKWIYDIMKDIDEYIVVDGGKIYFSKTKTKDNRDNNDKYITEKVNFLIDKFVSRDDIYKFLLKYLKYRKESWNNIENHLMQQYVDFRDYIKNKIILSIDGNM